MTESFDIVSSLVTVFPALGVLGWWIKELRADNKQLRADNKALQEVLVELSRDQIRVNTELKSVIEYKLK